MFPVCFCLKTSIYFGVEIKVSSILNFSDFTAVWHRDRKDCLEEFVVCVT